MKEKRDRKGGRTPLPDEEKRKNLVATKLTDIELEVARAKAEAFKMTVYELLKEALNRCVISVKQYDEFVKIVDRFSLSHLMRLCIIRSVVYPRLTAEELAVYKDLTVYDCNRSGVGNGIYTQCAFAATRGTTACAVCIFGCE